MLTIAITAVPRLAPLPTAATGPVEDLPADELPAGTVLLMKIRLETMGGNALSLPRISGDRIDELLA